MKSLEKQKREILIKLKCGSKCMRCIYPCLRKTEIKQALTALTALDKPRIDEKKLLEVLVKLKLPGDTQMAGTYFNSTNPKDNSTVKILYRRFCLMLVEAIAQKAEEWLK